MAAERRDRPRSLVKIGTPSFRVLSAMLAADAVHRRARRRQDQQW
jgi:hypothetical protein